MANRRFDLEFNDAWQWLESNRHKVSDLGRAVATILSRGYRCGIYNVPNVRYADWSRTDYIELIVWGEVSTYDSQSLTRLLVACHDACVRLSISACNVPVRPDHEGFDYARAFLDEHLKEGEPTGAHLRLLFHARHEREGRMWARHPGMEEALIDIRSDHGKPDPEVCRWEGEGGSHVAA